MLKVAPNADKNDIYRALELIDSYYCDPVNRDDLPADVNEALLIVICGIQIPSDYPGAERVPA